MTELVYLSVTGNTWFQLDHKLMPGDVIEIKNVTFDYTKATGGRHQQLLSGGFSDKYRLAGDGGKFYINYGSGSGSLSLYNILDDDDIKVTPTEAFINNEKVGNITSGYWASNTNMVVFANTSSGNDTVQNQTASVGIITITDSANTVVAKYIPMLDNEQTPCFYNQISDSYSYKSGTGTPIAGPAAHTFDCNPTSLKFDASGGSQTVVINAETGWTCTTIPTGFTLSATSGDSGTTNITVTSPLYTGATDIIEYAVFTDDDGYTANLKLRKKAPSAGGLSNLFVGDSNIETLYIGDEQIQIMYMGTEIVYEYGTTPTPPTPTGSTGTLTISVGDSITEDMGDVYVPYTVTLSGQSQDVVGIVHWACSQMDYDTLSDGGDPNSIEMFAAYASYETGNTANGRLYVEGLPEEGYTVDYVFIKAYGLDSNGNIIQSVSAITEDIEMSFEPIVDETCSMCGGSGEIEEDGEMITCPNCGGSGIEPAPEEEFE